MTGEKPVISDDSKHRIILLASENVNIGKMACKTMIPILVAKTEENQKQKAKKANHNNFPKNQNTLAGSSTKAHREKRKQ